jgi:deoxycytidine triphosphate deaminase
MSALNDRQLLELLATRPTIVEGLREPADIAERDNPNSKWYAGWSPIQAASIDLRVGSIFVPGTDGKRGGSVDQPLSEHRLKPGDTVLVQTAERFDLPNDIAGIGVAPFKFAAKGMLVTAVGHIDPGYKGPLRLTIINMANEEQTILAGEHVATVMLLRLNEPAIAGYAKRSKGRADLTTEILTKLPKDFLNINERTLKLIDDMSHQQDIKLRDAQLRIHDNLPRLRQLYLFAFLLPVIAALCGLAIAASQHALEGVIGQTRQLGEIDNRVTKLEHQLKVVRTPQAPTAKTRH